MHLGGAAPNFFFLCDADICTCDSWSAGHDCPTNIRLKMEQIQFVNMRQEQTMNDNEKINILLREYDALRAEIRSRSDNQFTLLGFAGLVLTWLFSRGPGIRLLLYLAILAPLLFLMNFLIIQAIK